MPGSVQFLTHSASLVRFPSIIDIASKFVHVSIHIAHLYKSNYSHTHMCLIGTSVFIVLIELCQRLQKQFMFESLLGAVLPCILDQILIFITLRTENKFYIYGLLTEFASNLPYMVNIRQPMFLISDFMPTYVVLIRFLLIMQKMSHLRQKEHEQQLEQEHLEKKERRDCCPEVVCTC